LEKKEEKGGNASFGIQIKDWYFEAKVVGP